MRMHEKMSSTKFENAAYQLRNELLFDCMLFFSTSLILTLYLTLHTAKSILYTVYHAKRMKRNGQVVEKMQGVPLPEGVPLPD